MLDHATQPPAGLLKAGDAAPVPLEGVAVEARLRDFVSRVTVAQRFRNADPQPIEAVYVFPLEEGAAVCGFEALIDGAHVVGCVKEREQAFADYDDAIAAGHGGYLLDQERPDVFTASIGNLPAGAEVLVRISYVAELEREGDAIRFALPTTVSPRYAPAQDVRGVSPTPAEALNPPRAFSVPYGLTLGIDLEMASAIRRVESPTHALSVEVDGKRGTVRLASEEVALDHDLVLTVALTEPHVPRALVETTPAGETVALLAFEPRFDAREAAGEIVFLLDCSGSMNGPSIVEARNALQLCLRSLRTGWRFNVVRFGSSFESLFPEPQPYGEDTLAAASRAVARYEANLGGTEILAPLQSILAASVPPGQTRQLFVLTDGQVTNTEAVIALVRSHSLDTRVFTFGIGAGASAHLVRGIARAGEGSAEFVQPGERIQAKVLRQLKRALSAGLTEVAVDWGGLRVRQAPHHAPPVFDGGRVLVYGFLDALASTEVTLRARGPAGPVSFALRVDAEGAPTGTLLATLAARAMIRDLEEGRSPLHDRRGSLQERGGRDRVKAEIVRLGTTYGLVSRETSFVAVEVRATPLEGDAVLRRVPVALPRDWGGIEGVTGRFAGARLAPAMARASRVFDASVSLGSAASFGSVEESGDEMMASRRQERSVRDRPVDRLVALQRADGSWELTAELAHILGLPLGELDYALRGAVGDPQEAQRAWATALALMWLIKHGHWSDEWELLTDKARAWLRGVNARPPDWLELARAVLRA